MRNFKWFALRRPAVWKTEGRDPKNTATKKKKAFAVFVRLDCSKKESAFLKRREQVW